MKEMNRRKLSLLSLILALLLILPLAVRTPVLGAEGIATWDKASYADLEDLAPDLVAKYVESDPSNGISMDMSFDYGFTFDDSAERNRPETFAFGGALNMLANPDGTAKVNLALQIDLMGDAGEYLADVYVMNDEENPGDLIVTTYDGGFGVDETDRTYSAMQEVVPGDELDFLAFSDLTVDEFNGFATMKLVEEQGETVEAVTLISLEKFIDVVARAINGPEAEVEFQYFNVEGIVSEIQNFSTQAGLSEIVVPIHMTLEKETGHMIRASIDHEGLQELIDKIFEVYSQAEDASTQTSPLTLNSQSFVIENVQYGVNEPIVLPEEVVEAVEAMNSFDSSGAELPDAEVEIVEEEVAEEDSAQDTAE